MRLTPRLAAGQALPADTGGSLVTKALQGHGENSDNLLKSAQCDVSAPSREREGEGTGVNLFFWAMGIPALLEHLLLDVHPQ